MVLQYLAERPGQLVSKTELLTTLWPDVTVSDGVLKTYVWEIRRALADRRRPPRFIETIPRKGYRFIGSVAADAVSRAKFPGQNFKSQLAPRLQPLVSSFVGRAAELVQLRSYLQKALTRERQIIFVAGEPGIGKTTLIEAFLQQAATQPDILIAYGQCIEHYGTSEAYLPVLTAVGRLCREPGGTPLLKLFHRYAPTWLAQLPALLNSTERTRLERETQGATRGRMLREFAEAVETITASRPMILWLDDLHWSDASTLDLVSFLASRHEPAQLLIIATYRLGEILGNGHPLQAIVQELTAHRQCSEVRLAPLSPVAIEQYLLQRFSGETKESAPSSLSLRELTHAIHRRTEGNPLFMVNAVEHLLAQGAITQVNGQWDFHRATVHLQNSVPPSIQQLIERQIDQLRPIDQQVLEVASVVGTEFSAAAVASGLGITVEEMEGKCAELVRRAFFLRSTGVAEWPDGTVASCYSFLHVLYQHVFYERIPRSRRIGLHQRIGERIEQGYSPQTREVAAALAVHFEQGRDFSRAIHYLRQAGENATRRSAHSEAVSLFTRGLALLQFLPRTAERTQQEIRLSLALGAPLITLKGYAAPEVEDVYTRARVLCQQIGDTRDLFPATLGLCGVRHNQAEFRQAHVLAQQLVRLAQKEGDVTRRLWAYVFSGTVLHQTGKFTHAQKHFTAGIALYDAQRHNPHISDVIQDPGVHCRCYLAEIFWLQGYGDQARQYCSQALNLARQLAHAHSQAVALSSATLLYNWLGERQIARNLAEELVTLTQEQGFPQWLAVGIFRRGWTLAQQGSTREGIQQMQQGLVALQATGAKLWLPLFSCALAWAHAGAGRPGEGVPLLAAAQAMMEKTGERCYAAELYRLKGELTLQQQGKVQSSERQVPSPQPSTPDTQAEVEGEAEECFFKAIAIARKQQAKSLELRAAMSLARLWRQQGKQQEAHKLLSPTYHWFTEGFDTADLTAARALLAALR